MKPSPSCGHLFYLHCTLDKLAADVKLIRRRDDSRDGWDPNETEFVRRRPNHDNSSKEVMFEIVRTEHLAETAEEYLSLSVKTLKEYFDKACAAVKKSCFRREKPLLAYEWLFPPSGPGHDLKPGQFLVPAHEIIYKSINDLGVDFALCSESPEVFEALNKLRHQLCPWEDGPFWMLDDDVKAHALRLQDAAREDRLAVFIGAGVSIPSGLPSWWGLLELLANKANFNEKQRADLQSMSMLDQPVLMEKRMGRKAFKQAVADIVSTNGRFTPAHVLLHQLLIPAITTNYDTLYELAGDSVNKRTPRLPWDRTSLFHESTGQSLLKLHGSVHDPESIVLTRQDYNRFGDEREALRGMVASMMVEKEILFVGFSMTDDNVHVIIDRVLKVCQEQEADGNHRKLGTILALVENEMFNEYWGERFQVFSCGKSWNDQPAWRHDCFLSFLVHGLKRRWPILSPYYGSLLSEPELKLREALMAIVRLGEQQEINESEVWRDTVEPFLLHLGAFISSKCKSKAEEPSKKVINEDLNTSSDFASTKSGLGLSESTGESQAEMNRMAAAQDNCPKGHQLQKGVAPSDFYCNHCEEITPASTTAYSCRICDYDVCSKCMQTAKWFYLTPKPPSGPWMPKSRSWTLARKYLAMMELAKAFSSENNSRHTWVKPKEMGFVG